MDEESFVTKLMIESVLKVYEKPESNFVTKHCTIECYDNVLWKFMTPKQVEAWVKQFLSGNYYFDENMNIIPVS